MNTLVKTRRQALRRNATREERILWQYLKEKQLHGIKFIRQYSVGPYILDFYSPQYRIGLELDGSQHYTKQGLEYDAIRTNYIESYGIKIYRFTNNEVQKNIEGVLEKIRLTCN